MKVLVINCGSSSLKYQLIDMESETVIAKGLCERIGIDGSRLVYDRQVGGKQVMEQPLPTHKEAIKLVVDTLADPQIGVVQSMSEIDAVGHRVVHGGERFANSTIINDEVLKAIEECNDLAPLHNPANLIGINVCHELMPETPMVAVFDTAFHQTMPEEAYLYGIPYRLYRKHKVRRYGFHGTSHNYVAKQAALMDGRPFEELKIIVCHLGNGASVTAVKRGVSVDTSMGMTPLEGLIMGTRSGDIDPAVLEYLMHKEEMDIDQVMAMLNKESGVLGLSELTSDFRDLNSEAANGNENAQRALKTYGYKVVKYIGSYVAAMNGVDIICFTAGLGENDRNIRTQVCRNLEYLGINIDQEKNAISGADVVVSTPDSRVKVMAIPTNEELAIARETRERLEA
ncbi:MAG: acetate/propionate family kinase [Lachnospiraceae bacterium]